MMRNKKTKPILLTVLASASLLLAGCDDFEAKPVPEIYDAPILNLGDNDIAQNAMSEIYNALVVAGDSNSERVLNNILYLYSTTVYGPFFDQVVGDTTVKGLRTVVEGGDATALQEFANTYPAYKDAEGNGDTSKVVSFYADVLYRIRSTFFGYVKDSNYQDGRSGFVEKEFYDAQIANYYDLPRVEDDVYPYNRGSMQIDGSFVLTEDIEETGSIKLDGGNRENADDIENAYFKDIFGTYESYINSAILPDIYRSQLTVQYLYTVNRSTLELSSARKINYIALADNTAYPGATRNLMVSYANNVIEAGLDTGKYGLTFLDSLAKGYDYATGLWDGDAEKKDLATKIYTDANWTLSSIDLTPDDEEDVPLNYYVQSSYGTILTDYAKLTDSRFTDDASIRTDFTGSGTHTVETGLMIKTNALRAEDHTTDGWFANASAVDDSYPLATTLFDTRVANEVDSVTYDAATGKYVNAELDYGYYRNGSYYLLPENIDSASSTPYIYLNDSTYYITIVEEAVKRAKVNSSYEDQYYDLQPAHVDDEGSFAEMVLRKIGYSLSSSDTWTKSARSYYVELMATVFHDTYVYDYFVSTFPDIFD